MTYVVIYYILSTLLYLGIGTDSSYWYLFNMVSILIPLLVFLYGTKPNTLTFKMWVDFACYMTIGRIVCTAAASYAPYEWVTNINIVFTIIYSLWLIIHLTIRSGGRKLI